MKRRDFIIAATSGVGAAWIGSQELARAMSALPALPRKFSAADTVTLGKTGITTSRLAMGTGTDVAMDTAGITLVKGDLRGMVRARRLSRATIGNIKQNLAFAFVYNALGVPVAAGVFYPVFGWLLSPMLASAAMSFSSVSVIANALRLRKASL